MTEDQAKVLMQQISNLLAGHKASYKHHYDPFTRCYVLTVNKVAYQVKEDDSE